MIGPSFGCAAARSHQVLLWVLLRVCPSSPHHSVALFHPVMWDDGHVCEGGVV